MRPVCLVLAFAALLHTSTSRAQYLYLDTDGDGRNTAADQLAPLGAPTSVDVWLITNENRDGTTVSCNSQDGPLSMSSYEIILHADGGTVQYGTYENALLGMTQAMGEISSSTDYRTGFGGASLDPGTYRLGRVEITASTGAPRILVVPSSPLGATFLTGFGTRCSGSDFDNTYKLGVDWFDADGVGPPPGGNSVPSLTAPSLVPGVEGAPVSVTVTATDADAADVLTISQSGMPDGFSFTHAPGTSPRSATIAGTPSFDQAGNYPIHWEVEDGVNDPVLASTVLAIANTNRGPELQQPSNMMVAEGTTAIQTLTGSDPDAFTALGFFKQTGPAYVVVSTLTATTGRVQVSPPFGSAGIVSVTVGVTDGLLTDLRSLSITVQVGDQPPRFLTTTAEVLMAAGEIREVELTAIDPEGQPLEFSMAQGPAYATVGTTHPGPGVAIGFVRLEPGVSDIGERFVDVQVSDGTSADLWSMRIQVRALVLEVPHGMAVRSGGIADQRLVARTSDGSPIHFTKVFGPDYVTVTTLDPGTGTGIGNIHVAPPAYGQDWAPIVVRATSDGGSVEESIQLLVYENQTVVDFETPDLGGSPFLAINPYLDPTGFVAFEAQGALVGLVRNSSTSACVPPADAGQTLGTGSVGSIGLSGFPIVARFSRELFPVAVSVDVQVPAGSIVRLRLFRSNGVGIGELVEEALPEAGSCEGYGITSRKTLTLIANQPAGYAIVDVPLDRNQGIGRVFVIDDFRVTRQTPILNMPEAAEAFGGEPFLLGVLAQDPEGGMLESLTADLSGLPNGTNAIFEADGDNTNGALRWTPDRDDERSEPYDVVVRAMASGRTGTKRCGIAIVPPPAGMDQRQTLWDYRAGSVGGLLAQVVRAGVAGALTELYLPVFCQDTGDLLVEIQGVSSDGLPNGTVLATQAVPGSELNVLPFGLRRVALTQPPLLSEGELFAIVMTSSGCGVHQSPVGNLYPFGAAYFKDWNFPSSPWAPLGLGSGRADLPFLTVMSSPNRAPTALAGGPYEGVVGASIQFDGGSSSDPDGDALSFRWTFGDGGEAVGASPQHVYTAGGDFLVSLEVRDGALTDTDETTARVQASLPARGFSVDSRTIALGSSSRPRTCFQLEPQGGGYSIVDIDPASLSMVSPGTGSVERIAAVSDKGATFADMDRNGISEISVCFRREDLRLLFSTLDGRTEVTVRLEGTLLNGARFAAPLRFAVLGTAGNLSASVRPNPATSKGTLTFITSRPGPYDIRLFDVGGRLVATLREERWAQAGLQSVSIESRSGFPSGLYFYRITTPYGSAGGRIVIVR